MLAMPNVSYENRNQEKLLEGPHQHIPQEKSSRRAAIISQVKVKACAGLPGFMMRCGHRLPMGW